MHLLILEILHKASAAINACTEGDSACWRSRANVLVSRAVRNACFQIARPWLLFIFSLAEEHHFAKPTTS